MKKFLILLAIALLLSSMLVMAVDDEEEENECGIFNLGSCITQKLFEYIANVINAPISLLISLVKNLLSEPVIVSIFEYLWKIMAYIISIFYSLLFLYAGFSFMTSGHDVVKREKAKQWLKNIIIMIILIQASFYLYDLVLQINGALTSGVLSLIDENFFLLSVDSLINSQLQLFFTLPYVLTLLVTAYLLILRYAIVSVGVALLPIGLFLYFIEPLKDYGRLILNFLGTSIFISFFSSIILLAFSKLLDLSIFSSLKIMIMISAFLSVSLVIIYFLFFSAIKSAFKAGGKVASLVVKYGKYLA